MRATRTNIITGVEVTESNVKGCPVLPTLLKTSNKRFDLKPVSADKGYLSDSNLQTINAIGAEPFIPPKVNNSIRPSE